MKKLSILLLGTLVSMSLAACQPTGSAEDSGKKADQYAQKVGDTLNPKGPMQKAGRAIDRSADEASS